MATTTSGAGGAFFCSLNVPYRVTTGSPPSSQHDRRVTRVHAWRHTSSPRPLRTPPRPAPRTCPPTNTLNPAPKRKHRAEREHPRRDRAVSAELRLSSAAVVAAVRARALGSTPQRRTLTGDTQGTGLGPHIDIARSHSHADDSACTLMSPAASGCPTAAHITLPHARGVMSFNRAN